MGIFTKLDDVLFNDKNFGKIVTEDGYVEYLEGDGASYIDTLWSGYRANYSDIAGEIPSNAPKFEIKYNNNGDTFIPLVGTLSEAQPCITMTTNKIQYIGKGANFEFVSAVDAEEHTVEIGSVYSYIDDVQIADNSDMSNQYRINPYPDMTILLFGGYYITAEDSSFRMTQHTKIYYFKAYEGDNLILDLRPYRKNGIGCMRDELTGTIYENKGTGVFGMGNLLN